MADLDSSGYRADWVSPGVIRGSSKCGSSDNNTMIIINSGAFYLCHASGCCVQRATSIRI